jgi:acyl-CoA thioesterase-1
MISRRLLAALLAAVLGNGASAAELAAPAKRAPNPSLAPITDTPGLPRVLLIGDSISMGYTLPVRALLAGKANVHRIPQNGGPTKNGVAHIDAWLGSGKWDVIHFNWGIHDLKYMPDGKRQVEPAEYEKNLRALVAKMKESGAKLIWATTTPIPGGELNPPRRFAQVAEYNAIAARVMTEEGVSTDDLNTAVTPHLAEFQNPKDVHYKPAGYEFLAKQVAVSIEAALPAAK